jgi:ABC-type transport system substrate-binding protein
MAKRIIALILCLAACVAVFAGCAGSIDPTDENKGQQITMYLTENVYDLDPAHAYINESTRSVVSLLFDTLFILDENGKVKPSLAESYTVEEKIDKSDASKSEYYMYITLKDTNWSDNTPISADDVVFAWKRALSYNN